MVYNRYMLKKIVFIQICVAVFALPLIASVALASAAPVGPCYPFSRSLSVGVSGSDVTALQEYLSAQGYFNVSPTGYFGVITRAAVGRWQSVNGIAALGAYGSGTFGPLSRGYFSRSCGSGNGVGGSGTGGGSSTAPTFSATPQSGAAPLTVQFSSMVAQGGDLGTVINFGDGTSGTLGVVPVCSSCEARALVSHTYTSAGTYTATLTGGTCICPPGEVCNCPNIPILGTVTVTVNASGATTSSIQQLNAPAIVTLALGGIAEIRNESVYFTAQSITSSSATIHITPVGCWNSFPSDPPPGVLCMIAPVAIPSQTLTVGEAYNATNYTITLTQLSGSTATFSIGLNSTNSTNY